MIALDTVSSFPHLSEDANWTLQNDAGQRTRAVYSKDAASVQAALIGAQNVHLGGRTVLGGVSGPPAYLIGLDFPDAMARAMVVYRMLARRRDEHRRHYLTQATRIRWAFCSCGLRKVS